MYAIVSAKSLFRGVTFERVGEKPWVGPRGDQDDRGTEQHHDADLPVSSRKRDERRKDRSAQED